MALQRKIPRGGGLPGFLRHLPAGAGPGDCRGMAGGVQMARSGAAGQPRRGDKHGGADRRRAFQCHDLFRVDVRDARGIPLLPQAKARPHGRGAFLPARAESRAVALGGVLHALDLGRAGAVAEPDARGAERLRARGVGDRDGRGDGPLSKR